MKSKINHVELRFNEELKPMQPPRQIIIHHTHNPNLTVKSTHDLHIERFKWAGIGYNYFIEQNGDVFEGRGMYVGAHAKGHNVDSIGIALSGNLDENIPSFEQMEALIELCIDFMYEYDIEPSRVIGHRELPNVEKTCPGLMFDMDMFRELLVKRVAKK